MLSVGVHKDENIPCGCARAPFNRGAIAHGVGVVYELDLVLLAHGHRVVARSIVNDDDFGIRKAFH